jgi:hypothetical protein
MSQMRYPKGKIKILLASKLKCLSRKALGRWGETRKSPQPDLIVHYWVRELPQSQLITINRQQPTHIRRLQPQIILIKS